MYHEPLNNRNGKEGLTLLDNIDNYNFKYFFYFAMDSNDCDVSPACAQTCESAWAEGSDNLHCQARWGEGGGREHPHDQEDGENLQV